MNTYALVCFDGELLYHNNCRPLVVVAKFNVEDEHDINHIFRQNKGKALRVLQDQKFINFWCQVLTRIREIDEDFPVESLDWETSEHGDEDKAITDEAFSIMWKAMVDHQINCLEFLDYYSREEINSFALIDTNTVLYDILKTCGEELLVEQ